MSAQRSFLGVHHIKFPSSDIRKTQEFYTTHLPFHYLPELDHINPTTKSVYAVILKHSESNLILEIRHDPEQAARQEHWDPVTWAVQGQKDLENWRDYFEISNVKHSKVFNAVKGWLLCAEDSDGRRIRFYTIDSHEVTTDVDHDAYWLDN